MRKRISLIWGFHILEHIAWFSGIVFGLLMDQTVGSLGLGPLKRGGR